MNVLDLFSGIGGFSLGLERAGMRTVAFCEIEPYCQAVLRKHWPNVPIFGDIRKLTADTLRTWGISVDVICGGFPCQDISVAGRGAGIEGERSGLWSEYARIIGELRPRYVIVENVSALLGRGLDRVLGDLSALGFDAEWHCIPASAVGAPHRRDRLWIIANAERDNGRPDAAGHGLSSEPAELQPAHGKACADYHTPFRRDVADATQQPKREPPEEDHAVTSGRQAWDEFGGSGQQLADPDRKPLLGASIAWPERTAWDSEPEMGRVVDGVSHRLVEDELRGLGNAVVPQIPEIIGRAIMTHMNGVVGGSRDPA